MNKLTNKTKVIVTRLGDFWVTNEQADRIMSISEQTPDDNIILEDNVIKGRNIDGALTAESYDKLQKKRRGGWQCKYAQWHERGQQCAHAQLQRGL